MQRRLDADRRLASTSPTPPRRHYRASCMDGGLQTQNQSSRSKQHTNTRETMTDQYFTIFSL
jgi:hypothetical protein